MKKLNQMHFFLGRNAVTIKTRWRIWNTIVIQVPWAILFDKNKYQLSPGDRQHWYVPAVLCEQGKFLTDNTLQTHMGS